MEDRQRARNTAAMGESKEVAFRGARMNAAATAWAPRKSIFSRGPEVTLMAGYQGDSQTWQGRSIWNSAAALLRRYLKPSTVLRNFGKSITLF